MKAFLNFGRKILISNYKRLSFPYKLTFAVTYRCNYRCKTCEIWKRKPENELSLEEITKFFEKSNKFNWIDFTGGEVWLRKDFTKVVEASLRYCKNLVMLHFPTNGYLTEQIVRGVKHIMEIGPQRLIISVSVDGDEELNDQIRGKKGGWRRQIETYKRLYEIPHVEVFLGMTLSKFNADQYEKAFGAVLKECPWVKPTDFHINIAHESAHFYGNTGSDTLFTSKPLLQEQVNKYKSHRGLPLSPVAYMERRYLKHVARYLSTGRTPMRCHALNSSCFVDPWGNVYPCGMYDSKIANLRDYDFDLRKIWTLTKTIDLQKEIWEYQCPQCWTPCEAYQSILGNLLGLRNRSTRT